LSGTDKGHITYPGTVRCRGSELALQKIGRSLGRVVMFYRQPEAPLTLCLYACQFA